ncbi:MAG: hypothetical protein WCG04_00495 [Alphaproteobacteria bacterium]
MRIVFSPLAAFVHRKTATALVTGPAKALGTLGHAGCRQDILEANGKGAGGGTQRSGLAKKSSPTPGRPL